jgi:hypothetical protein
MRDGAKQHARTLYCAVFDQKGAFLEGEPGAGKETIPAPLLKKLIQDLPMNKTVRGVLSALEKGEATKVSKALEWTGYPKERTPPPA